MIFGTGGRLRRSEQDPFEGLVRLAEDFKRRRKSTGAKSGPGGKPPQKKRVNEKGSVGRTRAPTRDRPLAPQPGGSHGVSGNGRPSGGQPPLALGQHGQPSASSASPGLSEPQVLPTRHWVDEVQTGQQLCLIPEDSPNAPPPVFTPQSVTPTGRSSTATGTLFPEHWDSGVIDSTQLYPVPVPESTPNAVPPPVPYPQTITPTGRPPTDKDTDWMDLDFLIAGERRTFHGFYTRLEYHSTVSPKLARLSKHGIQLRPPSAGLGQQAIMTLCIPVCIPNVSRECREKDVLMEVDELGKADFCVGVGILEKIRAVKAGLDLGVGSGVGSLSIGDLTPVVGMNTPAPTSSYSGHQDIINAHGMEQTAFPHQPTQPIVSPTHGHDYTLFPGPINSGENAAVNPGETHAQPQVSIPSMWATSYVDASAPNLLDPMYGIGIGEASECFSQGEEFDSLAWEPLEGYEFAVDSFGSDSLHVPSSSADCM